MNTFQIIIIIQVIILQDSLYSCPSIQIRYFINYLFLSVNFPIPQLFKNEEKQLSFSCLLFSFKTKGLKLCLNNLDF